MKQKPIEYVLVNSANPVSNPVYFKPQRDDFVFDNLKLSPSDLKKIDLLTPGFVCHITQEGRSATTRNRDAIV